jgi:hypothetical protein
VYITAKEPLKAFKSVNAFSIVGWSRPWRASS